MYNDPAHPAGFSNAQTLYHYAKKVLPYVKYKDVYNFLDSSNTYTSFKAKKRKFKRRVIEKGSVDETWCIDTFFLLSLAKQNSNYKYVIVCCDLFSSFLFTRPTKTKREEEVISAFRSIIAQNRGIAPDKVFSDRGSELHFLDKSFEEFEITRYSTNNPEIKSSPVERQILELKKSLFKAMFHRSSLRWVDLLESVTYSLNHRRSKALFDYSPAECRLPENFNTLKNLFLKRKRNYESQFYDKKPEFSVNDTVKIRKKNDTFSRGFTEKFSPHTYEISSVLKTYPPTYRILPFKKHFYANELVRASPRKPSLYVAREEDLPMTLRSGKKKLEKNNAKRFLIKDHHDPSYSEWFDESDFKRLKSTQNFAND